MGQQEFPESPPKTEVLSVEDKQLTPEELSELGKEEIEVPETETEKIKPETEEKVKPEPEEEEKAEEEIEEEKEEITHDPLKDTKAELTRTQQELAKLKKVVNVAVADKQFREPPTAQEMFKLPERPTMPKPEESDDGITYAQKVAQTLEAQKTYDDIVSDYESFVAENPDWLDMQPAMQRVSRQFPELMYGRRAMHKIYKLAVLQEESSARKQARDEELARASETGAKVERDKVKATKAFVKPGVGVAKTKPSVPDFTHWSIQKIEKWIEDNKDKAIQLGLVKEE